MSPPHTGDFPLTWVDPADPKAIGNIRLAWGDTNPQVNSDAVGLPVAIIPTYIHPRMSVQRSCFTVHGRGPDSLLTQLGAADSSPLVARVHLPANHASRKSMRHELRILGISGETMFPDLLGLAEELSETQ